MPLKSSLFKRSCPLVQKSFYIEGILSKHRKTCDEKSLQPSSQSDENHA